MHDIEEALRRALKAHGHACEGRSAVIDGERLEFWCYEPSRRTRAPLTPAEKWSPFYTGRTTKQVMVPSGRPVLVARLAGRSAERRWPDKARRLEAQVPEIVAHIETLAQIAKDERAKSEAYHQQLDIDMRRAALRFYRTQLRDERRERLHAQATAWEEVVRLQAFLDAMRARMRRAPSPALIKWLAWAQAYVEALDPLSPAELTALADLEMSIDEAADDDGPPHPFEQEWRAEGFLEEYLDEFARADADACAKRKPL
jgi:hypothetical protein